MPTKPTITSLMKWYKRRGKPADRISALLEFFLILHFDATAGKTATTRKEIADYHNWTYKSTAKAVLQLESEGHWDVIEGNERKITFVPNITKGNDK